MESIPKQDELQEDLSNNALKECKCECSDGCEDMKTYDDNLEEDLETNTSTPHLSNENED